MNTYKKILIGIIIAALLSTNISSALQIQHSATQTSLNSTDEEPYNIENKAIEKTQYEPLSESYQEDVYIQNDGRITFTLTVEIPESTYAKNLCDMLGVSDQGKTDEIIDMPDQITSHQENDRLIISSGKEPYLTQINNEQLFLMGINNQITQSQIIPKTSTDTCRIMINGEGSIASSTMEYDIWTLNLGLNMEKDANNVLRFLDDFIKNRQLLLSGIPNQQVFQRQWSTTIHLPSQAVLLNGQRIETFTQTLDVGCGTFQTSVTVLNTTALRLESTMSIFEQKQIPPILGEHYKTLEIKYLLPNSPQKYSPDSQKTMETYTREPLFERGGVEIFSKKLGLPESKYNLSCEGEVTLSLTIDIKIDYTIVWVQANIQSSAILTIKNGGFPKDWMNFDSEWKDLWTGSTTFATIPTPVGPVNLNAGPMQYRLEVNIGGGVTQTISAFCNGSLKMGAKWDNGIKKIFEKDFTTNFPQPTINYTDVRFDVTFRLRFPIRAEYLEQIYVFVAPGLYFTLSIILPPDLNMKWYYRIGLDLTIGAGIEMDLGFFKMELVEKEWTLTDVLLREGGNTQGGANQDTLPPYTNVELCPMFYGYTGRDTLLYFNATDQAAYSQFPSGVNWTFFNISFSQGGFVNQYFDRESTGYMYSVPDAVTGTYVYNLTYRSADRKGNLESYHKINVSVDLHPPTSSITVYAPSMIQDGIYYVAANYTKIRFSSSDAEIGSYVMYRMYYNGNWTNWKNGKLNTALEIVLPQCRDGVCIVEYRGVDQLGNQEAVHSQTFYVANGIYNTNKTTYYATIPAACAAASTGNTITIAEGVYHTPQMISISVPLSLIGAGQYKTIINGIGGGFSSGFIRITNTNTVLLKGFTLKNATSSSGIVCKSVQSCTITQTSLNNLGVGIMVLDGCSNIAISNNIITTNAQYGITCHPENVPPPTTIHILSNTIGYNGDDGIQFSSVTQSDIRLNTIINNTGYGILLDQSSPGNTIEGNFIESNTDDGVYITSLCQGTNLFNNTISKNKNGVYIVSAGSHMILRNLIMGNTQTGLYLGSSNGNQIYLNSFVSNQGMNVNNYLGTGTRWNTSYFAGGGNYWSQFDEEEEGAYDRFSGEFQTVPDPDGIVDQGDADGGLLQFNVPGGGIDYLPLKYPYAAVVNVNTGEFFTHSIQEGINARNTTAGHILMVRPGVYHEKLLINKSIRILSYDKTYTIIDGRDNPGDIVNITADNVVFKGFTLRNINSTNPEDNALEITGDHCTISKLMIQSVTYGAGVYLRNATGDVIYDIDVIGNKYGFILRDSSQNTIYGNRLKNSVTAGFQGYHAYENTISMNQITNNLAGIQFDALSQNNHLYHNTLQNTQTNANDQSNNYWDAGNPLGGNYWSDYTTRYPSAHELDDLEVWDIPYQIPPSYNNQKDMYPLIDPYPTYPVMNVNTGRGYFNVQDAIDDHYTIDGQTIYVERGLYCDNIVYDKQVNLIGAGRLFTILDGNDQNDTIQVSVDHSRITGFTIQHSGDTIDEYVVGQDAGIDLVNGSAIIIGNTIHENAVGVYVRHDAHNNTITDNIFTGNQKAIWIDNSSHNLIMNNTIEGFGRGVFLEENCNDITIKDNEITGCEYGVWLRKECANIPITMNTFTDNNRGIFIEEKCSNVTISENSFTDGSCGISLYPRWTTPSDELVIDHNIFTNNRFGIIAAGRHHLITHNTLVNNSYGIQLFGYAHEVSLNTIDQSTEYGIITEGYGNWYYDEFADRYIEIVYNTISNSGQGICLLYPSIIHDNTITQNEYGIYVKTVRNQIYENTISSNLQAGVAFSMETSDNFLSDNAIIQGGGSGILFDGGHDNNILYNNLSENTNQGILIRNSAYQNTILGNTIENSAVGVHCIEGSSQNIVKENTFSTNDQHIIADGTTHENHFYHNNFLIGLVEPVHDDATTNTWGLGYPSGGNYWDFLPTIDDYYGEYQDKLGKDGILDSSYQIPGIGDRHDTYPLSHRYDPGHKVINLDTNEYFSSVLEAVSDPDTHDGDTVFVRSGTYPENVIIQKSISLIGENKYTTILDGGGKNDVIVIINSSVTVREFTIRNCGHEFHDAGIDIWSDNNQITDTIIVDNSPSGIKLMQTAHYNNISHNLIGRIGSDANYYGIFIDDNASNNMITENIITHNYYGVKAAPLSQGNNIYYNDFIGNTFSAYDEGANLWSDGYGLGNNWSDYDGVDNDHNGIGDMPYFIAPYGASDDFPSMYFLNYVNNTAVVIPDTSAYNRYICFTAGTRERSSLVSFWHFDENAGSIAYDSIGDNDGAIYGATWTSGVNGSALAFDSNNHYDHVVGTYNGTYLALYVDGELMGTQPLSRIYSTDGPIYIGTDNTLMYFSFFNGVIDEISYYNRSLSSDEVQIIYTRGVLPEKENVPLAYYVTLTDSSVFPELEGWSKWVGPLDTYNTAFMDCTPTYHWLDNPTLIYVGDEDIVPKTNYSVQTTDGVMFSEPVIVPTIKCWGDMNFDGLTNFYDIDDFISYWQAVDIQSHIQGDLGGKIPDRRINVLDIYPFVGAITGSSYPFGTPSSCPPPFSEEEIMRPTGDLIKEWYVMPPYITTHYSQVDDVIPDDNNTYVYSRFPYTNEQYLLSHPTIQTDHIYEIRVHIRASLLFPTSQDAFYLFLANQSSPNTKNFSDPYSFFYGGEYWEDFEWICPSNPFTGQEWTIEDLDNLTVGINAITPGVKCTQLYISVISDIAPEKRSQPNKTRDAAGTLSMNFSKTVLTPSDTLTITAFLDDVQDLQGYQVSLSLRRLSGSDTLFIQNPNGVRILENRPDYLFYGMQRIGTPIEKEETLEFSQSLMGSGATITSPKYIGEYRFSVPADARGESTYELSASPYPGTIFVDSNGEPLEINSTTTYQITILGANTLPYTPFSPQPANLSIGQLLTTTLQWQGGDADDGDTVTYTVYFGEAIDPPMYVTNITETTCILGDLSYNTIYYWRIVASDGRALVSGPLWHFTTQIAGNHAPDAPSRPVPINQSVGVPRDVILVWSGSDPDGDTLTYDVYFGTSNPPTKKTSSQTSTTYNPGSLNYTTVYYWRIVAWDNHSAFTTGSLWSFTTQGQPAPPAPSQVNDTTPWNIYAADLYKGIGGYPGRYGGQPASYRSNSTETGSDLYFNFSWGDGNNTVVGPVSGFANASFTYGHWGMYNITVTVQHGSSGTPSAPSVARSVRMFKAGDMNNDDRVTFADIDPFVEALSGHAAWVTAHPDRYWFTADCNFNHGVTFADIDPFVAVIGT